MITEPDLPRSMRDPSVRATRLASLNEPHIAPLSNYVAELRERDSAQYPQFDPADGGVHASILFLLEKPGPMTVDAGRGARTGSGFISRDNDDPTAEAAFAFYRQAGVPRKQSVLWNVIPGWNGTIKVTTDELRAGIEDVQTLVALLPKLKAIVLVGKRAARAEELIGRAGDYEIFKSPHPSPQVRFTNPALWHSIPGIWKEAWKATQ